MLSYTPDLTSLDLNLTLLTNNRRKRAYWFLAVICSLVLGILLGIERSYATNNANYLALMAGCPVFTAAFFRVMLCLPVCQYPIPERSIKRARELVLEDMMKVEHRVFVLQGYVNELLARTFASNTEIKNKLKYLKQQLRELYDNVPNARIALASHQDSDPIHELRTLHLRLERHVRTYASQYRATQQATLQAAPEPEPSNLITVVGSPRSSSEEEAVVERPVTPPPLVAHVAPLPPLVTWAPSSTPDRPPSPPANKLPRRWSFSMVN